MVNMLFETRIAGEKHVATITREQRRRGRVALYRRLETPAPAGHPPLGDQGGVIPGTPRIFLRNCEVPALVSILENALN